MSGEGLTGDEWASIIATLPEVGLRTREPLLDAVERVVARRESEAAEKARAEVVAGVRAWCAINEIAEAPLDWEGLGEFLTRADSVAQGREETRP